MQIMKQARIGRPGSILLEKMEANLQHVSKGFLWSDLCETNSNWLTKFKPIY